MICYQTVCKNMIILAMFLKNIYYKEMLKKRKNNMRNLVFRPNEAGLIRQLSRQKMLAARPDDLILIPGTLLLSPDIHMYTLAHHSIPPPPSKQRNK